MLDKRINPAWWALRIGLGAGAFIAGLDKFFNILTNWEMYLSPLALKLSPVSPEHMMRGVGVIEMVVGLAVLIRWTRLASYVMSLWLLSIAVNLVTTGMFYDLAFRDVEIAIAAFTLARLTAVRESAAAGRVRSALADQPVAA